MDAYSQCRREFGGGARFKAALSGHGNPALSSKTPSSAQSELAFCGIQRPTANARCDRDLPKVCADGAGGNSVYWCVHLQQRRHLSSEFSGCEEALALRREWYTGKS